jgi:crotonobetainyl-CoA:carnitine CoA-transferase CaiB-like acyl-CoA transferase
MAASDQSDPAMAKTPTPNPKTVGPLSGVRLLEVGGGLAAAYAVKLLVDLGAEATVIEPASGSPLRNAAALSPRGSLIFQYLRSGCNSVVLARDAEGIELLLLAHAQTDITIDALPPGQWTNLMMSYRAPALPGSVVIHISPFGQTGPRKGQRATSLTLQAMAGWSHRIVGDGGEPLFAGGDLDAYGGGVHAAVAALTAWRQAHTTASSVESDVSLFECLVGMLPYPTVHAEILNAAGLAMPPIIRSLPGVLACRDGWVGINPLNQQGWNDVCEIMGIPEFRDQLRQVQADPALTMVFRTQAELWLRQQDGDDIVDLMQSMRVPATRVLDGRGLLNHPQLRTRNAFIRQPGDDFLRPAPPWRFSSTSLPLPSVAPPLGRDTENPWRTPRLPPKEVLSVRSESRHSTWGGGRPNLPYSGLKVFDLSVYWAGPIITMYLASFGADVVKVESHQRPDPFRYSTSLPELGEDWWERSAVWQSTNLNKRSLTLDLTNSVAQEIASRFIAQADVLIENFSPRVLDHLGIDVSAACASNRSLIVVRLPGFGLDGPYRDHIAWAPTFEQASGLANVTGEQDGAPTPPGGCADPLAGMHGLLALQAALVHRDRTGEGQVIEMAQLEALTALTADQVIAASGNGELPTRHGNQHPNIAPHGVYPCLGADEWIAIAAQDDEWETLAAEVGRADLLADPELADLATRQAWRHELDASIRVWTSQRSARQAEATLRNCGVTVAAVVDPALLGDDEQLRARGYFQAIDRPATATYRYPGWPMRYSFDPDTPHAHAAPTLGEHTEDLLAHVLGMSGSEIERLSADGVIGTGMSLRR